LQAELSNPSFWTVKQVISPPLEKGGEGDLRKYCATPRVSMSFDKKYLTIYGYF
jgi:hypothetical protein